MSETKPEDLNSQAVPFFARFLEGQSCEDLSDEDSAAISGGCKFVTYKYPSDNEDGGVTTKKYPSDNDEYATTQKYPSDNKDNGKTTMKYPSDNDERVS